MPTNGTVTFKDLAPNFSTMQFENCTDAAALDTLATYLDGKSVCQVSKKGFISNVIVSVDGAGNIDKKAIITATDSVNHTHKWAWPGYNGATEQDTKGEKMTATELRDVLDAIETATGLVLSPLRSPIIQTR